MRSDNESGVAPRGARGFIVIAVLWILAALSACAALMVASVFANSVCAWSAAIRSSMASGVRAPTAAAARASGSTSRRSPGARRN